MVIYYVIYFKKPERNEYQKISDLVNLADEQYRTICTPEEFSIMQYGCSSPSELIKGENQRIFLCAYDENDNLIGYSSFRLKNPQTVWLSMIYIHPDFQHKGNGALLLKEIERQAEILGALVIVLETEKKATWAVEFYKKNGYQILSDADLLKFPFDQVLDHKQVDRRYIFGKKIRSV
jgi:GNAT superfamily N-acetyltransferase